MVCGYYNDRQRRQKKWGSEKKLKCLKRFVDTVQEVPDLRTEIVISFTKEEFLAVDENFLGRSDSRFPQANVLRKIIDVLEKEKCFLLIKEWKYYIKSIGSSLVEELEEKCHNNSGGHGKNFYTALYYVENLLLKFTEDNPTRYDKKTIDKLLLSPKDGFYRLPYGNELELQPLTYQFQAHSLGLAYDTEYINTIKFLYELSGNFTLEMSNSLKITHGVLSDKNLAFEVYLYCVVAAILYLKTGKIHRLVFAEGRDNMKTYFKNNKERTRHVVKIIHRTEVRDNMQNPTSAVMQSLYDYLFHGEFLADFVCKVNSFIEQEMEVWPAHLILVNPNIYGF